MHAYIPADPLRVRQDLLADPMLFMLAGVAEGSFGLVNSYENTTNNDV